MNPIELHEASKAALACHWKTCPYRCNTNHVKCHQGWRLIAVEEAARVAAIMETFGLNEWFGDCALQPEPHEPCCPAPLPEAGAAPDGGAS